MTLRQIQYQVRIYLELPEAKKLVAGDAEELKRLMALIEEQVRKAENE